MMQATIKIEGDETEAVPALLRAVGAEDGAARLIGDDLVVPGVAQADLDAAAASIDFEAEGLAALRRAAKRAVDEAAEAARLAFITAGEGQSMVYQAKAAEAAAAEADPAPVAADYPLLAAEVGITAPDTGDMAADIKAVAAVVTAMRGAWLTAAAAIEATRLGAKADLDAAGDGAAIQVVLDALDWPAPETA